MLSESKNQPSPKQNDVIVSGEVHGGNVPSANSSGRFKTIVRRAARKAQAKPSLLELNLYEPLSRQNENDQSSSSHNLRIFRQTLSSFLRMATRDLREPLAILRTGLAVLKRQEKSEQSLEVIEEMERAVVRATNTIGTYLDLEDCESIGRLELRCEPVSIGSLISEEIKKLKVVIPERVLDTIRIQNFVTDKATLWADRDKLGQVFAILIGRAIRHLAQDGTISLEHHSTSASEVIEISCQGRRISSGTLKALSSPVIDKTLDKISTLDLRAAQKLVEVHQGKLIFDSEATQGNRIWVILPRTGSIDESRRH